MSIAKLLILWLAATVCLCGFVIFIAICPIFGHLVLSVKLRLSTMITVRIEPFYLFRRRLNYSKRILFGIINCRIIHFLFQAALSAGIFIKAAIFHLTRIYYRLKVTNNIINGTKQHMTRIRVIWMKSPAKCEQK